MSTLQQDVLPQADRITYEDLYRRWEQGSWSAMELDFSEDREGWRALTDLQRTSGLWLYSMFFSGEDSVTDTLSPYIDAAPREEQKYFLATQQADEARHAVFFHRFFKEVVGAGGSIADTLAYSRSQLGWGYRRVFERLDRMADELRRDRSLPKFAQAITMYHMVVEATLAQPGQHFIEDYFIKAGTLPGFSAGMVNVSRDEQRHIAFGVKVLAELFAASDECKAAAAELLAETFPYALATPVPPNFDRRYTRDYGFELEDLYAFAIRSVRAKFRAAGYPLEDMPPGVFPVDPELPEEKAADRLIAMLEAGILLPDSAIESTPEAQALFFDLIGRSIDPALAGGRPITIQWRFNDAVPWHLHLDNGSSRAEPGEDPDPDVTVDTDWKTWIDVAIRGASPVEATLRRRLRTRGKPGALWRLRPLVRARRTIH
jgi:ribonucleotide reductase small subunit/alkyl sulfatase-like protein